VELDAKRKSLLVSRKRVAGELEATQHPRRKEQLQAALDHLDRELAQLGPDKLPSGEAADKRG
jgi:hypothetical protein